ncbi:hypothetical protein TPA0908_41790 [Micromonospora sp. AKA38]|nr:hypothetical protein TPA0908_41790 [Micromonospora sp. AKA38]
MRSISTERKVSSLMPANLPGGRRRQRTNVTSGKPAEGRDKEVGTRCRTGGWPPPPGATWRWWSMSTLAA